MTHVNIYDFDGVLAEPLEEALFTMPSTPVDSEFVTKVCDNMGLDLSCESPLSQRYICIQAVLEYINWPINPGPLFDRIEGPFHVMTARCDRFAVARVHQFLEEHALQPIKVMHMDHLAKGKLLDVILERHPENTYSFYDDNLKHIESAMKLQNERLSVFHVDNNMQPFYTRAFKLYTNTILEVVL